MSELNFEVEAVGPEERSLSPLLIFKLRITCTDPHEIIESVALRCQLQIESQRRRYSAEEQSRLADLFGESDRWNQTLRPMLWTHTSAIVPPFVDSIVASLPVPCTFDFNVAATKYFSGLVDGEVPLILLFSGSVFYRDAEEILQVTQIPWDREARYRMPVQIWQRMMDAYYPNSAWLNLRRDVYDRLCQFKVRHGIPTWEQAIERLLVADGHGTNGPVKDANGSCVAERMPG